MGDEARHSREQGERIGRTMRARELEDPEAMLTDLEVIALELQWSDPAQEPVRTLKARRLKGGTEP